MANLSPAAVRSRRLTIGQTHDESVNLGGHKAKHGENREERGREVSALLSYSEWNIPRLWVAGLCGKSLWREMNPGPLRIGWWKVAPQRYTRSRLPTLITRTRRASS